MSAFMSSINGLTSAGRSTKNIILAAFSVSSYSLQLEFVRTSPSNFTMVYTTAYKGKKNLSSF